MVVALGLAGITGQLEQLELDAESEHPPHLEEGDSVRVRSPRGAETKIATEITFPERSDPEATRGNTP